MGNPEREEGRGRGRTRPVAALGKPGSQSAERFDPLPQTPWAAEPRGTHSRSQRGALSPSPGGRSRGRGRRQPPSPSGLWAAWLGGWMRAGWGACPGCSQDPPSAEVCQGRELIKHDESGEREPVRCPPAAPAPAGPSPGARHTRGPPVPACAAAASWSVRAPLGAGDAWGLGIGSAGDLPSHLGLRLA